jgi:hypothetical protein
MCVGKRRDDVIIGDILLKTRGDARIVGDPPVPRASLFDGFLPPDTLVLKRHMKISSTSSFPS